MLAGSAAAFGAALTSGCAPHTSTSPPGTPPRAGVDGAGREVEILDGTLESRHWPGRPARWAAAVPTAARGTVIALHGRGGSAADWFDGLDAPGHAARTGLAVAAIDGGDRYWHRRRAGDDTGAMVVRDFLPLLTDRGLPTKKVGFTGLSMGGYGALLLASEVGRARCYGVAAMSSALWTRPGDSAPGAFDDREDFLRHDVFARTAALRALPVGLWCGTADPFIGGNRALAARLPQAKRVFGAGGHDGDYWSATLGPALDWLATFAPGA